MIYVEKGKEGENDFIKKLYSKPSSKFFEKRLANFVANMDEDDYRCKIVTKGLVKELFVFQKAYIKYMTDNFRLNYYQDVSLTEAKKFVPDIIMFLGAPEKDKRHVLFDCGHIPPWNGVIRESLDWLDRYLGPVQ